MDSHPHPPRRTFPSVAVARTSKGCFYHVLTLPGFIERVGQKFCCYTHRLAAADYHQESEQEGFEFWLPLGMIPLLFLAAFSLSLSGPPRLHARRESRQSPVLERKRKEGEEENNEMKGIFQQHQRPRDSLNSSPLFGLYYSIAKHHKRTLMTSRQLQFFG
ncbi:hypothetical protein CPC08DRAFT_706956 [Agrocybe pediades]|nr:hypothetical protein CPC08DRAFT_706956 [Agrocybe pediades]